MDRDDIVACSLIRYTRSTQLAEEGRKGSAWVQSNRFVSSEGRTARRGAARKQQVATKRARTATAGDHANERWRERTVARWRPRTLERQTRGPQNKRKTTARTMSAIKDCMSHGRCPCMREVPLCNIGTPHEEEPHGTAGVLLDFDKAIYRKLWQ